MRLPWRVPEPLAPELFGEVRRQTIFECCKWDPQVEDVSVLAPFPLILTADAWHELSGLAERLSLETAAAETELSERRDLWRRLGLGLKTRRALTEPESAGSVDHARVARFDFHWTTEGWKISEANTDVPGGFNEASGFTRLMERHYPGARRCGDPIEVLMGAIRRRIAPPATVALAHATAYTDDRQVMVYLARHLEAEGFQTVLVSPDHLRWENHCARVESGWYSGSVALVIRFFPAEWLPSLPRACGWRHFFRGSATPLCNPATALLTQTKRFPLVWNEIETPLPVWRRLLPETCDPRQAPWPANSDWLVKPVFGRVGDSIGLAGVTPEKEWKRIRHSVRFFPRHWAAQRRFEPVPLETPLGAFFPCIGVYTVDGRAAGVYGRIARQPLINHLSHEIAVLVERPKPPAAPAMPALEPNRALAASSCF